ncbi:hypothetical protein [Salinimicrobium sp. GXAS 041]|uniref:hypothetical protein n=1 Tax=Salinimicrobium sp. GXAS 041 TaxID=3400806 RepID=UPI003C706ACF
MNYLTIASTMGGRYKRGTEPSYINIISPAEGQEVESTAALQMEINASEINVVFPAEGQEVTGVEELQLELE